ncbi:MAG: AmpG family muropeptide MFS transporter [Gammaproteobacteria bacterium]|nr:AmpG family muropeptide MFS transporter [Gammaproteobacteria bacterium]MBK6583532.1 AmpG family muropeptide MFS transporter [Gammaproteobacteria bacterium]MBK7521870.1 AmpG family muropeptide MFS transporter [Gammaproteobacteria bacterium]MBK7727655.1 AmpG family muropeptide MFS transporter [Gammaproteobacteria bacterium]MBK9665342.1 AmpG family muropeptide MFS transporter [Gammaproteobacteria bacterium]
MAASIFNRRVLECVFLGFTSGLPLYVLIQLVPLWMKDAGVDLAGIGLFTLVGIPYTWKFLWSPLMERYRVPLLGRRRGWMLLTQLLLLGTIASIGFLDPGKTLWHLAALCVAVAFFSASQDIVVDAYRRELLPDHELGIGNAVHVQAYRIAGLVPGSLALVLAEYLPWTSVYLVVAGFMLIGVMNTLFIREVVDRPVLPVSLREAITRPFQEFFGRLGWRLAVMTLAFMFLYKLGDSMATALSYPFYRELGFSLTEIGVIAKTASLAAVIIGALLGGVWMIRLGINNALWLFGGVQLLSILGFALLAETGPDRMTLAVVIVFEYLGVGLGTAAFTAFIARCTNPLFAATQFALLTALTALPRTLANAATGFLVEWVGWTMFFLLCFVLAIPGMLLLLKVAPWERKT